MAVQPTASNFHDDLSISIATDRYVADSLVKYFSLDSVKMMDGFFPDYDVILYKNGRIWYKVEIKTDYKTGETGNLYFEMKNCRQNNPSGLTATKADHYAHYVPCHNTILWYGPAEMRLWLANAERMSRPGIERKTKAGDNNSAGLIARYEDIKSRQWVKTIPVDPAPITTHAAAMARI